MSTWLIASKCKPLSNKAFNVFSHTADLSRSLLRPPASVGSASLSRLPGALQPSASLGSSPELLWPQPWSVEQKPSILTEQKKGTATVPLCLLRSASALRENSQENGPAACSLPACSSILKGFLCSLRHLVRTFDLV